MAKIQYILVKFRLAMIVALSVALLNSPIASNAKTSTLERMKVIFAEESGTVDSFKLSGLEEESKVGESLSITITAIDESGLTVTDYTGTIRFSSTDDSATLPNDYEFTAEDLGEHSFSLGFKFVTPGDQTVTVTDTESTDITGEISTEVVTSYSDLEQEVDYEEDFETEDFEREGDFTLISPASGSYSSNDVLVQGEADYGYVAVIYIDEEEVAKTEVEAENTFEYTVEDLEDGTFEIYVDIADTTVNEDGEEEVVEVIETSDIETIEIDTSTPELVELTVDPEGTLTPGETVTLTVLSESELEEVTVLFNEEVYEFEESSTAGKYETEIVMPETEGEYSLDITLIDALGNEVQYRDQATLTVAEETEEETEEEVVEEVIEEVEEIPAPTGLSSSSGREEVTLSWEAAEAEDDVTIEFYRIYYGPAKDALLATDETLDSSTSWVMSDLTGKEIYYFAVAAVDADGNEGELSDTVSATPLAKLSTSESTEYYPSAESSTPEISSTGTPDESPETGPRENALITLSLILSIAYFGIKKLAKQENF